MKFIIPEGGPRQFSSVPVKVSAKVLAEILCFIRTGNEVADWGYRLKRADGEFLCFGSGAKLCKRGRSFYIYGYHYSGEDILSAIGELKMAECLRKAQEYSSAIWKGFKSVPNLKVTFIWPGDRGYRKL